MWLDGVLKIQYSAMPPFSLLAKPHPFVLTLFLLRCIQHTIKYNYSQNYSTFSLQNKDSALLA